jgi:hypothetical protein
MKLGVERSGTPGSIEHKNRARETGDSIDLDEGPAISDAVTIMERLSPVYRAPITLDHFPGARAPGFMLTPAPQADDGR